MQFNYKEIGRIWLITDTHLGHDKMVEYCGRPENHSEIILENIVNILHPGDILIHLGDVCIGHDIEWHYKLMTALTGITRILIKGNHDRKSINWYLSHGWNIVFGGSGGLMQFNDTRILFSHEPWIKTGDAQINIHGHMHNNSHRMDDTTKSWYDPKYNKLLAIENTDLKPVLLQNYIEKLNL